MRQLNHDLKLLQDDARDGAYGTRSGRSFNLALMANTLHELGYRRLRATGLRGKHVEALVREWQHAGLSIGTMKNRMSHLRWWAKRIGKPNVVRADNASYGIGDRNARPTRTGAATCRTTGWRWSRMNTSAWR
ncbi:MAG: hypothetical protein OXL38_22850 [Gammaproteobacteria bacterium]|nr:hypothetical protein [Gammaproteobacteria bacterium]